MHPPLPAIGHYDGPTNRNHQYAIESDYKVLGALGKIG
jgi:hypothetical protein